MVVLFVVVGLRKRARAARLLDAWDSEEARAEGLISLAWDSDASMPPDDDGAGNDDQSAGRDGMPAHGSQGDAARFFPSDDLVAARSGLLASQWAYRDGPVFLTLPIASYSAAMLAAGAVCAALLARERTGWGQQVEVSWLAGALAMQTGGLAGTEEIELDLRAGQILGVVKRFKEGSSYQVMLPSGAAGVRGDATDSRGTVYVLKSTGNLAVLAGKIAIAIASDNTVAQVISTDQQLDSASGQVTKLAADAPAPRRNCGRPARAPHPATTPRCRGYCSTGKARRPFVAAVR
jgi:hypothetical protein